MATMEFDFPDDFLGNLLESDFKEIADEALKEAVPTLEKSVKSECAAVINDKTRHELVDSIVPWKGVVHTKTDAYMLGVHFEGKPSRKTKWTRNGETKSRVTTNNDIAWWLEHGNRHQAAKPFIDRASESASTNVMKIMQEVYERKVKL